MNGRCRIDRLSISLCWFESNLLCSPNCVLIQTVSKTLDNVKNADFSGRCEKNPNENLTFELHLSCFVAVFGFGLEQNIDRCLRRTGFAFLHFCRLGSFRVTETTLLYCSSSATVSGTRSIGDGGDTVSKSRARHSSFHAFGPTGSVSGARASGQIERSQAGNVYRFVRPSLSPHSIGVAESAGLYLTRRKIDSGVSGTSLGKNIRLQFGLERLRRFQFCNWH